MLTDRASQATFDPLDLRGVTDIDDMLARIRPYGDHAWGRPPYPGLGTTLYLLGHRPVESALRCRELVHAPAGGVDARDADMWSRPALRWLALTMILADPPRHGGLRRPLTRFFTVDAARQLEERYRRAAQQRAERCSEAGAFDLVRDYAGPFAVDALAIRMGLPVIDVGWLKTCTARLARILDVLSGEDSEALDSADAAIDEQGSWIDRVVRDRQYQSDGLFATMVAEYECGNWNRDDLIANAVFFLFAGQETVTDAITHAVLALDAAPEQRAGLVERGGDERVVEELLRFAPPVQLLPARIASADLYIEGIFVPAGTPVSCMLLSANRDPAVFHKPDTLDLQREPGRALSFGVGAHTCIGARLARIELLAAVDTLHGVMPALQVRRAGIDRRPGVAFRGITGLPVDAGCASQR